MSEVFISYARSTEATARRIAEALRALGYGVWRDDELPAHRAYSDVIEEQLKAAKAVVVLWSAEAVKSQWVRAEAEVAREAGTLVQLSLDASTPPLPFNQIQFADLHDWSGDTEHAGWRKVLGSIADLAGATATVASGPAAKARIRELPDKPSIAVLALADLSPAKDQDYFCDGMVEEIVTALSRYKGLFVIAAASSLTFRDANRDLAAIAQQLGVRYILEGSVRRAGDRVRITVSLTNAVEMATIWSERFDGNVADIFDLQDTVANAVAAQIAPTLADAEVERARSKPVANLGAYEMYLRATAAISDYSAEAAKAAIGLIDQVLELQPEDIRALSIGAMLRLMLIINGWTTDLANLRAEATDLAHRAMRHGDDDPEIMIQVAAILNGLEGDGVTATALATRAIELNPGSAAVRHTAGILAIYVGHAEEGFESLKTADRLNPRAPLRHISLGAQGLALVLMRRFQDAEPLLREALQRRPSMSLSRAVLAIALAHLGRLTEAAEVIASLPKDWNPGAYLGLFRREADTQLLIEGFRLAGFSI
jgi:adenylate cyclase